MSEEKIKKEDYEQYWQKGGTYVLPIEIFNELFYDIEQLQQENEKLKKYCCKRNDCAGRLKENNKLIDSDILTEFEKWLKERIKVGNKELENNKFTDIYITTLERVLRKLQELKEGKK